MQIYTQQDLAVKHALPYLLPSVVLNYLERQNCAFKNILLRVTETRKLIFVILRKQNLSEVSNCAGKFSVCSCLLGS